MATKLFKAATASVKAGPEDGLAEGEFIGYASVFGNVDSYGDIVDAGAFAKTLEEWKGSGLSIPALLGHDFYDPFSNIGQVVEASEDEKGLLVRVQLDLENPKAAQVYRLLKAKRVGQMSFAYDILDSGKGDDGYHLKELKLYEVSVVPIGANQETEIVAVKSPAHLNALRKAQDAIAAIIAASDSEAKGNEDHEGKASEDPQGQAAEDPNGKLAALASITNQLSLERVQS